MTVRVAVVGLGKIGKRHLEVYRSHPGAEVVGVCDVVPELAAATGKELGVPWFSSVGELLAGVSRLDAASVATAGEENGGDHYAPTMELLGAGVAVLGEKPISNAVEMEGHSLVPLWADDEPPLEPEWYLSEATWMRKHGWRTPEWKLIMALEPDFHAKPEVELYHLSSDPGELDNRAESEPDALSYLQSRLRAHLARREAETARPAPILGAADWHGFATGPFKTSKQAYDTLRLKSRSRARSLQAGQGAETTAPVEGR